MTPGKEDECELVQDVRVRDVEVVFEGRYGNVAVKLSMVSTGHLARIQTGEYNMAIPYILLHVFLSRQHRGLADLEAHLCRRIVDESSKRRGKHAAAALGGTRLIWVAIARALRLGNWGRW